MPFVFPGAVTVLAADIETVKVDVAVENTETVEVTAVVVVLGKRAK